MNTEFLRKMTKAEISAYSYYALCNLFESTIDADDSEEFKQLMSEFTSDIKGYVNVLSIMLRYLGVSCNGLQDKTEFDVNNEDYFTDILNRLQDLHYEDIHNIPKEIDNLNYLTHIDLSKYLVS